MSRSNNPFLQTRNAESVHSPCGSINQSPRCHRGRMHRTPRAFCVEALVAHAKSRAKKRTEWMEKSENLVDPASSHMLLSRTKPCTCKRKRSLCTDFLEKPTSLRVGRAGAWMEECNHSASIYTRHSSLPVGDAWF